MLKHEKSSMAVSKETVLEKPNTYIHVPDTHIHALSMQGSKDTMHRLDR